MRYVLLVCLSLWWINGYCLDRVGFPRPLIEPQARYDLLAYQKPAIEAVVWFNRFENPRELVVYGIWCEDLRSYADFQLIGSIYGYADHYTFVEKSASGILTLHDWLKGYGVQYLIWDNGKAERWEPYFDFNIPSDSVAWGLYFERVPVEWGAEGLNIWKLR